MKLLIRVITIVAVYIALVSFSYSALAAARGWNIPLVTPSTTNITPGVAANITATVTVDNKNSGSTSFLGTSTNYVQVSPSDPTLTVSISPNTSSYPATKTTNVLTLTFSATASTPSNTYVVSVIIDTNPPNATLVTPVTNTFTVTMATAAPFNPLKVWTPGGINSNWSTSGNWTPNGSPGSSNDVKFFDPGTVGAPGTVDNTVDAAATIGSLTLGQTNNYHTTLISPGLTLSLTGTNGLSAGTGSDNGDSFVSISTITGTAGTLTVNNVAANVNVGQPHPTSNNGVSQSRATLDLAGLDTFNATAARMVVGVDLTIKGSSGVLNLAKTNRITLTGAAAPQLDVGDNSQSGGTPTISSLLVLGQTNAIFADSIAVGRGKTDANGASMYFNGSFANSVAYFRASNGSGRVSTWSIGDGAGARTYWAYGTNDFTGGSVDALVDTMYVGKGASVALGAGANNPGNGYLILSAGTIDVNTLEVGYTIDGTGAGIVNANGGSLLVNSSLELAHGAGSSGTLNIFGGTVSANSGITSGGGASTIAMSGGALNVTNATATIGSGGSPLATLAVTNSTVKVAAQIGTASATVGTLSCGGANSLSFSSIPVITALPSQYQVIQYTTPDGNLASFSVGSLPSGAYSGYISNNIANSSLDLVITNGPVVPALVWHGNVNSNWDTATANWKTNGVSTTYQQNYPVVRFDDAATGTNFVFLTTTLTPGAVSVNNSSRDYTLGGAGKLSGGMGLIKTGARTLVLSESGGDDFTGGIKVEDGTLQVGNGGTSGTLPAGSVSVDGALVFNRSDNLTVSSVISGAGSLTQTGASIVTLTGTNSSFGGTITVARGTLQPGNTAALGSASTTVTVTNSAALDVNGLAFNNNQAITVSGPGVNSAGAIVNNGADQTKVLRNVTMAGNTTFGGGSDWDIHSTANGASDATLGTGGNGFKLTKVGTNTVTLFGAQVDGSLGDIDIQVGSLSFERNTTSMGDPSKTATVFTNATLQLQNASNVWSKVVVLKDGGTLRAVNGDEFAGPVTLESGIGTLLAGSGAQLILDAAVGGAGGLSKNGSGTLTLTTASSYSGPTVISQGTLSLIGTASIDTSTNITVSSGSVLDLSTLASPTLTMTSGRSLEGSGTVVGAVTMATGSTLAPGGGSNTLGAMTITNNLMLQGGSTNVMEVAKSGSTPINDQIIATNVSYGGTLVVAGAGGAFAAGDVFKLFSAGSYANSFSAFNLPPNVTWNTTQLGTDGTLRIISVARPQIGSIVRTNSGAFQLAFTGPGGNSYRVWATTNIALSPITNWTLLVSGAMFDATGAATFIDTDATNYSRRFYVISVP